ncbi:MAG TPA: hypothetical protein VF017_00485 [Thermoanaerobaculia bacterium]|nr:hypothetical protein [Thermoanaerobaculia bacterium]
MSENEIPSAAYQSVAPAVRHLAQRLKAELKASGARADDVASAQGLSEAAWTRLLADPSRLEVRQLFAALAAARLHPAEFFVRLRRERGRILPNLALLAEVAGTRPLGVDLEEARTVEGEVRRLADLLLAKLQAGQRKLRPSSLELGLSADRLGQLLREGGPLKVWHVLALLRLLDLKPETFFDELYGLVDGLPDGLLPGGHRWSELKAVVARLDRDLTSLEADPSWLDPEGRGDSAQGMEAWEEPRTGWDSSALAEREAESLTGSWTEDGEKG